MIRRSFALTHLLRASFAVALLSVMLAGTASAQLRIGILNPQEVLSALPETKALETDLEAFVTKRQQDFEAKYTAWLEEVTQFQQNLQSGVLSEQAQQEITAQLGATQQELEVMEQRFQVDLQTKRAELLEPLLTRMETAMQEVAKEKGLDFILNEATATGDPIVYFASSKATNVTQNVIDKLKKR